MVKNYHYYPEYHGLPYPVKVVIDKHCQDNNISLSKMIQDFGGSVKSSTIPFGLSHRTIVDDGFTIYVNRHARNQRVIVAHALSHILLHRDLIENLPNQKFEENVLLRDQSLPEERHLEANRLMCNILLPPDLIDHEDLGDLNDIAIRYQVPYALVDNLFSKVSP